MSTNIWQELTNLTSDKEVAAEMVKKYKNTYLKISKDGHVLYGKYRGTSENGIFHLFMDIYGQLVKLAKDTTALVTIWYPKNGLYNIKDNTNREYMLYFRRTAFRQYRKGINEDSCNISNPPIDLYDPFHGNQFTFENLVQIAENKFKFRHLDEIIPNLINPESPISSVAITNNWGISAPITENNECVLWLHNKPVAFVSNNRINFIEKCFIQELFDESTNSWYAGYQIG